MIASGVRSSETSDDGFDELRARCERCIGLLDEISRIHLEIDTPTRKMQADEPDWIYRLRKVCLHVMAIKGWNIGPDVEQVMASELRAAYEQVGAVWKDLPKEFRLEEMDGDWWAKEAKNGVLATYDHPTPQMLLLPAGRGGLSGSEHGRSFAQLAVWLGGLGLGYGIALAYLAQVLGSGRDVETRVAEALGEVMEGTE